MTLSRNSIAIRGQKTTYYTPKKAQKQCFYQENR